VSTQGAGESGKIAPRPTPPGQAEASAHAAAQPAAHPKPRLHEVDDARAAAEAAWLARLDASIGAKPTTSPRLSKAMGVSSSASPSAPLAPPVVELPGPHPAQLDAALLLRACDRTHARTGGPGGQNRNKVQTGVVLVHGATGIAARAGERRSIGENLPVALRRLRLNLAVLVRCPVPAGEARSELWLRRCPQTGKNAGRIVLNVAHDDFPAMLATSLDVLWACNLDAGQAAARLVCTPSQLVKLWKDHMPALLWVNGQREARGMRAFL
jgi:hypothetical protein